GEIMMRTPKRGKAALPRQAHLLAHILERHSYIGTRWKLRADIESNLLHCHYLSSSFRAARVLRRRVTDGRPPRALLAPSRAAYDALWTQSDTFKQAAVDSKGRALAMSSLVSKLEGGFGEDPGSRSGVRRGDALGFVVADAVLAGDKDHPRRAEIVQVARIMPCG